MIDTCIAPLANTGFSFIFLPPTHTHTPFPCPSPSSPFIKYCMKRVNMLIQHNVTPVMVFDGGYLPTKAQTEKTRRE